MTARPRVTRAIPAKTASASSSTGAAATRQSSAKTVTATRLTRIEPGGSEQNPMHR